jgi:hypothetical protein
MQCNERFITKDGDCRCGGDGKETFRNFLDMTQQAEAQKAFVTS